jgi:hypothetical protein
MPELTARAKELIVRFDLLIEQVSAGIQNGA